MALWRSRLTVGDQQMPDFMTRFARAPRERALLDESWDWQQLHDTLREGEKRWARVAVAYVHEGGFPGHAFITDQRICFAMRHEVLFVDLPAITFVGRPKDRSVCDFLVNVFVSEGGGEPEGRSIAMNIRDRKAFHDFFPALIVCASEAGADLAADW